VHLQSVERDMGACQPKLQRTVGLAGNRNNLPINAVKVKVFYEPLYLFRPASLPPFAGQL